MENTVILYGIKNCDTVRKVRKIFETASLEYHFHDFRADGTSEELLNSWLESSDWEKLLNKRGTTWRKLDKAIQGSIKDANSAVRLMVEHPTLIKRPVLTVKEKVIIGFDKEAYKAIGIPC
jgi:Spx/MgsR family transcriptional regulator